MKTEHSHMTKFPKSFMHRKLGIIHGKSAFAIMMKWIKIFSKMLLLICNCITPTLAAFFSSSS